MVFAKQSQIFKSELLLGLHTIHYLFVYLSHNSHICFAVLNNFFEKLMFLCHIVLSLFSFFWDIFSVNFMIFWCLHSKRASHRLQRKMNAARHLPKPHCVDMRNFSGLFVIQLQYRRDFFLIYDQSFCNKGEIKTQDIVSNKDYFFVQYLDKLIKNAPFIWRTETLENQFSIFLISTRNTNYSSKLCIQRLFPLVFFKILLFPEILHLFIRNIFDSLNIYK